MTIIPAIDLKDGRCVRLRQGRSDDATVYSADPVEMARRWEGEGARYLHVVDLDGAFQGRPVHLGLIARIAAAVRTPVEVGGGLRREEDIEAALGCGVDRAIVGTRAFTEPDCLRGLAARFGRQIAVGIDAKDGFVQVKGWVETTGRKAVDLARSAEQSGVQTLIFTDTDRDGMLRGANIAALDAVCSAVRCDVIASGGITSEADVEALCGLRRGNLVGAIVGKALYEGTVGLASLQAAAGRAPAGGDS